MGRILKKATALSENGQGFLCLGIMLLLNAFAFLANTVGKMIMKYEASVSFGPRLTTEQETVESFGYKTASVFAVVLFILLLFVFISDSIKKSQEKGTINYAFLFCLCPVFLLGFIFVRHGVEFVFAMFFALLAFLMSDSRKTLWAVPLISALGVLYNAAFIFACFPFILLSLCGESEDKTLKKSSKKSVIFSAVICTVIFAGSVAFALLGSGEYIGAFDLVQAFDIQVFGFSPYDGVYPLMTDDFISVAVLCLPLLVLSIIFWITAIKTSKANGNKSKGIFIAALALNIVLIPAVIYYDTLGMLFFFEIFSQYALMFSLASKREPTVIEVLKISDRFFTQKKRFFFIVFLTFTELIICAYIENKI